jgi:hypothetical protein
MPYTRYPLQTGSNCVAFSYWVAMNEALLLDDPYKKLNFTPADVDSIVGGPAVPDGDFMVKMRERFRQFMFLTVADPTTPRAHPTVTACWDLGFPHAVCLLPHSTEVNFAYDPAYGNTDRRVDVEKCARAVEVIGLFSGDFPYARWYWNFPPFRWLIKP